MRPPFIDGALFDTAHSGDFTNALPYAEVMDEMKLGRRREPLRTMIGFSRSLDAKLRQGGIIDISAVNSKADSLVDRMANLALITKEEQVFTM